MDVHIYKVTCLQTNKIYIGQTQQYKHKNGKPYSYGVLGRWCDHVSSSKRSDSPLHSAIREHGPGNFTQELVETTTDALANEREAHWIHLLGTAVPNGYNVNVHSRCKHRDSDNPAAIYLDTATDVELKRVNRNGTPTLVYVYVTTPDGKERLTFGQSKTSTFEQALADATRCIEVFREHGVRVKDSDKRSEFENRDIQKIRLVPFNKTMVAVYLTVDGKQTRICFGGKHVTYDNSVNNAREFVRGLRTNVIEDNLSKSQQQVATFSDEANPESEK
jgi:hypothetical protein